MMKTLILISTIINSSIALPYSALSCIENPDSCTYAQCQEILSSDNQLSQCQRKFCDNNPAKKQCWNPNVAENQCRYGDVSKCTVKICHDNQEWAHCTKAWCAQKENLGKYGCAATAEQKKAIAEQKAEQKKANAQEVVKQLKASEQKIEVQLKEIAQKKKEQLKTVAQKKQAAAELKCKMKGICTKEICKDKVPEHYPYCPMSETNNKIEQDIFLRLANDKAKQLVLLAKDEKLEVIYKSRWEAVNKDAVSSCKGQKRDKRDDACQIAMNKVFYIREHYENKRYNVKADKKFMKARYFHMSLTGVIIACASILVCGILSAVVIKYTHYKYDNNHGCHEDHYHEYKN